jgi:hypothetical protein
VKGWSNNDRHTCLLLHYVQAYRKGNHFCLHFLIIWGAAFEETLNLSSQMRWEDNSTQVASKCKFGSAWQKLIEWINSVKIDSD